MKTIKFTILMMVICTMAYGGEITESTAEFESSSAKTAQKKFNSSVKRATDAYNKALTTAKKKYTKDLEKAQKTAMRSNKLDEATRIRNEITGEEGEVAAVKKSTKSVKGYLGAATQESGEIYINNKKIGKFGPSSAIFKIKLKVGDIIRIKLINKRVGIGGFVCAFSTKIGKDPLFVSNKSWGAYTPSNPIKWYKDNGTTATLGDGNDAESLSSLMKKMKIAETETPPHILHQSKYFYKEIFTNDLK